MDPTRWPGVFREGRDLYTINSTPGIRVYGETLREIGGTEYRSWDPFRSKLSALLARGGTLELPERVRAVLYLGGAHGTTVSHLSDLWPEAAIFVVEKSPTSFAPLLALARRRKNLFPMLADAQLPERYQADVGVVDLVYQDVAQRNQAAIFGENARVALSARGLGILMLKVRSVTQARSVSAIVQEARVRLERDGFQVRSETSLAPFSRDHVAFVLSPSHPSSTVRRSV